MSPQSGRRISLGHSQHIRAFRNEFGYILEFQKGFHLRDGSKFSKDRALKSARPRLAAHLEGPAPSAFTTFPIFSSHADRIYLAELLKVLLDLGLRVVLLTALAKTFLLSLAEPPSRANALTI